MATLKIENLYKKYDNSSHYAVNNLSFECNEREFIAILGPSGCGKTTTLRMIAGLETVSSGNICIDESVVNKTLPKERSIGLAFEDYALYPPLNIFENIAFNLRTKNIAETSIKNMVYEIADLLHVRDILHKRPKELSGGQMQRVNLARAIVRKPKILLLDEPMSHLDGKLRQRLRYEIRKLHQKIGCTTVLVTHDQLEAMSLADRLVIMDNGSLQQFATPAEIYKNPTNRFVAEFIGDPPMNILDTEIVSNNGQKYFAFERLQIPVSRHLQEQVVIGKTCKIGIRPDSVLLANNSDRLPIETFENLGEEKRIRISLGGKNKIMISTPENIRFNPGDTVSFQFIEDQIHIFEE